MVYLFTFAITFAVCALLCAAVNLVYAGLFAYLAGGGASLDSLPSVSRTRLVSVCAFVIAFVFVSGMVANAIANNCVGFSAREAFDMYASQSELSIEDYREIDAGDKVFFVKENAAGTSETWFVYEKSGLLYARSYNAATYYHYCVMNSDGTLGGIAATVAEVKTQEGWYYFVECFDGSFARGMEEETIVFNGAVVSLSYGTLYCSSTRLTSFSLVGATSVGLLF